MSSGVSIDELTDAFARATVDSFSGLSIGVLVEVEGKVIVVLATALEFAASPSL